MQGRLNSMQRRVTWTFDCCAVPSLIWAGSEEKFCLILQVFSEASLHTMTSSQYTMLLPYDLMFNVSIGAHAMLYPCWLFLHVLLYCMDVCSLFPELPTLHVPPTQHGKSMWVTCVCVRTCACVCVCMPVYAGLAMPGCFRVCSKQTPLTGTKCKAYLPCSELWAQ